jgi:hypothetical protein
MPDLTLIAGGIALWTGQRQGDLRLPWSAYAGDQIRLRQSKTGTRGWEDARVLRHELSHCSGWPGDQQLLIP